VSGTTKPDHPEVGRELKVSELKEETVVVVASDRHVVTAWFAFANAKFAFFWMGAASPGGVNLMLFRCGPEWEQLKDETGRDIRVYEYLGDV